jgi:hypothetical protein
LHGSLKLQWNLVAIGGCLVFALASALLTQPLPVVAWAVAVVFGIIAGVLQSRAIVSATDAFRSSRTAIQVRAALTSSAAGRQSLLVQWTLLPVLLGLAFWSGNLIAGALGGFALFMAVRDTLTLKAVVGLSATTQPSR